MIGQVIIVGVGIIVICIMLYTFIKLSDEKPISDDELENNPYDVPAPKGRMIDKFGYGKR